MTRWQRALGAVGACVAPCALFAGAALGADTPETPPTGGRAATAATTAPADVSLARRRLNVVSGRRAMLSGHVRPAAAGRRVALQRRAGGAWRTIARARTAGDGTFAFRFYPREAGSAPVRVRSGGERRHAGRLNVFRRAQASWYGPGLYGGRLGCGGTLTPGTLGVASRSLPCGAKVTLRHRGRTVRVPVVDRGPFAGGRELDLTAATRSRLGFDGVGTVLVAA